jgi:cell division protein FtsZ
MERNFTIDGTAKKNLIDMAQCLLSVGEINLGWDDIKKVLLQDGKMVIAYGSGNGKRRALDACEDALSSFRAAAGTAMKPTKLLFRLTGPESLLLKEVNDVKEMIEGSLCLTSEAIFGVARDAGLKDEVQIALLGTL